MSWMGRQTRVTVGRTDEQADGRTDGRVGRRAADGPSVGQTAVQTESTNVRAIVHVVAIQSKMRPHDSSTDVLSKSVQNGSGLSVLPQSLLSFPLVTEDSAQKTPKTSVRTSNGDFGRT